MHYFITNKWDTRIPAGLFDPFKEASTHSWLTTYLRKHEILIYSISAGNYTGHRTAPALTAETISILHLAYLIPVLHT